MSYAFIDRKCTNCNGTGCKICSGTGMVGSFEEVPDIPMNGDKEFGDKLRKTRERRLISMSELACILSCKVSQISEIECGITMPTDKQREKLEKWMNTIPNPGSDEAIAMGCTCPVLDNGHGNERLGKERGFVISCDCPIHGIEVEKTSM